MAVNIGKNQANGDRGGALNLEDFSGGNRPSNGGGKKKIIYVVLAALVLAVAIGGFSAYNHNKELNSRIYYVVEELSDAAGAGLYTVPKYPDRSEKGGPEFKAGGWYDQLKDNKKLAEAIVKKLNGVAYDTKEDGTTEFHYSQIGKVYRMAAVLEYLGYENETVKAKIDELTDLTLAAAQDSGNFATKQAVYEKLLPYRELTYYTGAQKLELAAVEGAYNARWQELQREISGGKADLYRFIDDLYETASINPITVPTEAPAGEAGSIAVNAVYIPEPLLDINRIMPVEELKAALRQYGEQAIFRSGQGGYYDVTRNTSSAYSVNNNTYYGDFRRQYVSGRVRRTGQEDDFTENYLRQHYDKPDKIYYYFKGETIGSLPTFFSDTREVYVYGKQVYAFTDYALYLQDTMLPYDYEKAKEMEFKHVDLNTADYQTAEASRAIAPYLREFQALSPTFQYDIENNLVTIYMQALPGTTEALKQAGQAGGNVGEALLPLSEDITIKWHDLSKLLTDLTQNLYNELYDELADTRTGRHVGFGLILISDVNPNAGLLSVLNGEVVTDNSADPPAPAEAAPDAEDPETAE